MSNLRAWWTAPPADYQIRPRETLLRRTSRFVDQRRYRERLHGEPPEHRDVDHIDAPDDPPDDIR